MTNIVDRKKKTDWAAGENCAHEEVAMESVQTEAQTTPIYTR